MQIERYPTDHGPVYTETMNYIESQSDSWLVEPYNAASAALFIIIAAIWLYRLRGSYRSHKFTLYGLVLLSIGGIGGTLYHALRTERLYLLMDWMPIVILSLSMTYWFARRLTGKRIWALAYMGGGFAVIWLTFFALFRYGGIGTATISIGYAAIALQAVAPIVLYLVRTKWKHSVWFFSGIASFALAAVFRATDSNGWLPMGTHFLWHLFGATMAYLLLEFIVRVESDVRLAENKLLNQPKQGISPGPSR